MEERRTSPVPVFGADHFRSLLRRPFSMSGGVNSQAHVPRLAASLLPLSASASEVPLQSAETEKLRVDARFEPVRGGLPAECKVLGLPITGSKFTSSGVLLPTATGGRRHFRRGTLAGLKASQQAKEIAGKRSLMVGHKVKEKNAVLETKEPDIPIKCVEELPGGACLREEEVPCAENPASTICSLDTREPPPKRRRRPWVSVIIDDMGVDYYSSMRAVKLKEKVTLSYLPYADDLKPQVAAATSAGHELMLHMPMQPWNSSANPGHSALMSQMSTEELKERLRWSLDQFDGYVGANNHMGSHFTSQARDGMEVVLAELNRRGLFFLDSLTSNESHGPELASKLGMRFATRDVFLDPVRNNSKLVARQLDALEKLARRNNHAIAIGHPYPATLRVLEKWLPTLRKKGFKLMPLEKALKQVQRQREHQACHAVLAATSEAQRQATAKAQQALQRGWQKQEAEAEQARGQVAREEAARRAAAETEGALGCGWVLAWEEFVDGGADLVEAARSRKKARRQVGQVAAADVDRWQVMRTVVEEAAKPAAAAQQKGLQGLLDRVRALNDRARAETCPQGPVESSQITSLVRKSFQIEISTQCHVQRARAWVFEGQVKRAKRLLSRGSFVRICKAETAIHAQDDSNGASVGLWLEPVPSFNGSRDPLVSQKVQKVEPVREKSTPGQRAGRVMDGGADSRAGSVGRGKENWGGEFPGGALQGGVTRAALSQADKGKAVVKTPCSCKEGSSGSDNWAEAKSSTTAEVSGNRGSEWGSSEAFETRAPAGGSRVARTGSSSSERSTAGQGMYRWRAPSGPEGSAGDSSGSAVVAGHVACKGRCHVAASQSTEVSPCSYSATGQAHSGGRGCEGLRVLMDAVSLEERTAIPGSSNSAADGKAWLGGRCPSPSSLSEVSWGGSSEFSGGRRTLSSSRSASSDMDTARVVPLDLDLLPCSADMAPQDWAVTDGKPSETLGESCFQERGGREGSCVVEVGELLGGLSLSEEAGENISLVSAASAELAAQGLAAQADVAEFEQSAGVRSMQAPAMEAPEVAGFTVFRPPEGPLGRLFGVGLALLDSPPTNPKAEVAVDGDRSVNNRADVASTADKAGDDLVASLTEPNVVLDLPPAKGHSGSVCGGLPAVISVEACEAASRKLVPAGDVQQADVEEPAELGGVSAVDTGEHDSKKLGAQEGQRRAGKEQAVTTPPSRFFDADSAKAEKAASAWQFGWFRTQAQGHLADQQGLASVCSLSYDKAGSASVPKGPSACESGTGDSSLHGGEEERGQFGSRQSSKRLHPG